MTKRYTDEELIKILKDFAIKIGEVPTKRLTIKHVLKPTIITYYDRFGSWVNALKIAGFEPKLPDRSNAGIRYKTINKVEEKTRYRVLRRPEHPFASKTGHVLEHRMIAYDNGLLKDKSMEVHHINGIKNDNRIENLQVLTKSEHASLTIKEQRRRRIYG